MCWSRGNSNKGSQSSVDGSRRYAVSFGFSCLKVHNTMSRMVPYEGSNIIADLINKNNN